MRNWLGRSVKGLQILIFGLVFSVAALPLFPLSTVAETVNDVVVLSDQKKMVEVEEEGVDVNSSVAEEATENSADNEAGDPETTKSESMSTWTKVGIGAGVVAVVGIALAAGGGGGGDDGPSFPTNASMVGIWSAQGTQRVGSKTYTGTYTLYDGGASRYDISLSDGEYLAGSGRWVQPAETLTLQIANDTGSVYVGEFVAGSFSTITMVTTNGDWQLVLTKM
ncbi:MAG: hypothetical protein GY702_17725 [Desulfobulbaceae bacterium]|nr:hypothetical protein [Desulfobulbaceae bacterium]